ncbi:hypothetical protein E1218_05575 [Kribbella turkmenica]|uniref:Uncharacterized protein n=1 Tax=Kribbella turkmenica TaxID=2530375 RepID=A0A4R4XEB9_9ACTN|nr:hypothetical protein [Kribbella turkmenica]TDD29035.1 hypothetical protein E1218_05575 [Kribbella turkmenica]
MTRKSRISAILAVLGLVDDRTLSFSLRGRKAAVYKELVCKSAAWGVANRCSASRPGAGASRTRPPGRRGVTGRRFRWLQPVTPCLLA